MRKQWASSPAVRQSPADYPVDFSDSDMTFGNFNTVGGATVIFNGSGLACSPRISGCAPRMVSPTIGH